jgi:hypothetical protein
MPAGMGGFLSYHIRRQPNISQFAKQIISHPAQAGYIITDDNAKAGEHIFVFSVFFTQIFASFLLAFSANDCYNQFAD